jgi:hypothetical protein
MASVKSVLGDFFDSVKARELQLYTIQNDYKCTIKCIMKCTMKCTNLGHRQQINMKTSISIAKCVLHICTCRCRCILVHILLYPT